MRRICDRFVAVFEYNFKDISNVIFLNKCKPNYKKLDNINYVIDVGASDNHIVHSVDECSYSENDLLVLIKKRYPK